MYLFSLCLFYFLPTSLFRHTTVLSKLLTSLNETDNKLSGEQELQFLQTLLQSKEINALVNVHHRVANLGKDDRIAPTLSSSMQVREKIAKVLIA